MGCGVSNTRTEKDNIPPQQQQQRRGAKTDEKVVRLPGSRLVFTDMQLERVAHKFNRLVQHGNKLDVMRDRRADSLAVVVERLIQRLVCSVGMLDQRFSSKYLINLDPLHDKLQGPRKRLSFRYLVRLDAVSMPALYPQHHKPAVKLVEVGECQTLPAGYCRLQMFGQEMEDWAEFINHSGYLRRDKVQERFVQLLAAAAARPCAPHSPRDVDESRLCGSPGKVMDPIALYHILQQPPSRQMFYGPAECNEARFPDPRDCRIVLVEGVPETRLHISFLSPSAQSLQAEEDIEVILTLAIGVDVWPRCSDFPARLPLDHVDVLLGYQAAQMVAPRREDQPRAWVLTHLLLFQGCYLLPQGPHHSLRCDDRCTVWEMRPVSSEMLWDQHYAAHSTVSKCASVLSGVLNILRARGVKTISRYIMKTQLYWEMERHSDLLQWAPRSLPRRVLQILDKLLISLRNGCARSYMIPHINLLLQDTVLEEDWVSDGDILEQYMKQLSREGPTCDDVQGDILSVHEQLEEATLSKWVSVMESLVPPASNRTSRLNSSVNVSYTKKQMAYVAAVCREMLKLKHSQTRKPYETHVLRPELDFQQKPSLKNRPGEANTARCGLDDLIYLLQVMFDQAKTKLLLDSKYTPCKRGTSKTGSFVESYEVSTALLLDGLKNEKWDEYDFENDTSLVAKVLECMYRAIDSDGRVLAVVLRPFVNQLFRGSHNNCWFLHEWLSRNDSAEMDAIGSFSELVISGDVDPLDGIIDSVNKGWNWAANCIDTLQGITEETSAGIIIGDKLDSEEAGLRVIWAPGPGQVVRRIVHLKDSGNTLQRVQKEEDQYGTVKNRGAVGTGTATLRSLGGDPTWKLTAEKGSWNMLNTVRKWRKPWGEKCPIHSTLRDTSPFTLASQATRRQGTHRGLGSIVPALISLHKLTVLQEISQHLPDEERNRVLNDLKKLSKEVQRMAVTNCRRRRSLPKETNRNRFSFRKSSKTGRTERKAKSATLPGRINHRTTNEDTTRESYKRSDLDDETDETLRKLKEREKKLEEELQKMNEDTLLGTCRLLRKQTRPSFTVDPRTVHAPFKTGRLRPNDASLQTPFYIKVSSFQNRQVTDI